MSFPVKDWKNFPNRSTPLSAEALQDMETRLSSYAEEMADKPEFSLLKYGALADHNPAGLAGTDASSPALQAVEDAFNAGGGTIKVTGKFRLTEEIEVPEGVTFAADNPAHSGLYWTDVPEAGWGLKPIATDDITPTSERFKLIRGLTLSGPGKSVDDFEGGVRLLSWVALDNCYLRLWNRAAVVDGNHQSIIRSAIINNYYALYYKAGTESSGDQTIFNTGMTLCDKASVGIENGATMLTSAFIDAHFGEAPYGIYAESADGDESMRDCDFISCNMEGYGSMAVDLQDNVMNNVHYHDTKFRRQDTEAEPGADDGSVIRCGLMREVTFDHPQYSLVGGSDRNPDGFIAAGSIERVEFTNADALIREHVDAFDWPLIYQVAGVIRDCHVHNAEGDYTFGRNSDPSAITRHRAMAWNGTADPGDALGVRNMLKVRYADDPAYTRLAGVAVHGGTNLQAILIKTRGLLNCEAAGAAGDIVAGDALRASTTAGKLETADGGSAGLMGVAYDDSYGVSPHVVPVRIDPTLLDPAGIALSDIEARDEIFRLLATGSAQITTAAVAGTKYFLSGGANVASGVGAGTLSAGGIVGALIAAADLDLAGKDTKVKVKASITPAATLTMDVTVGLYPVTLSGAVINIGATPVCSVTKVNAAVNNANLVETTLEDLPADGLYVLAAVPSATPNQNFSVRARAVVDHE